MVSASDQSVLRAILDVLAFILVAIFLIIKSILYQLVPASYKSTKSCEGEIVLITGGGSGIGRLLALRLAQLKATVVVWDINEEGVKETVKLVNGIGGKAFGFKCNIADREEVYKGAKMVAAQVGDVTMLINNAGVVSGEFLLKTPDHLIQRTFDVNIVAHFWTTKAFLPKMIEKDHGHIVTIASMAGQVGIGKLADYCSSKYAAVGFDEALRVELDTLGIKGVKTLCVCPYFIQATGMFGDVWSRILPRLKSNDVADRIVQGIQREEVLVMMPAIFRYVIFLKWLLPWSVLSILLRYLVPDASPHPVEGANSTNSTASANSTTATKVSQVPKTSVASLEGATIKQKVVEKQL